MVTLTLGPSARSSLRAERPARLEGTPGSKYLVRGLQRGLSGAARYSSDAVELAQSLRRTAPQSPWPANRHESLRDVRIPSCALPAPREAWELVSARARGGGM